MGSAVCSTRISPRCCPAARLMARSRTARWRSGTGGSPGSGRAATLPHQDGREVLELDGAWITPGLIDCHTHLVFGGDRAARVRAAPAGRALRRDRAARRRHPRRPCAATRAATEDGAAGRRPCHGWPLCRRAASPPSRSSPATALELACECRMLRVARGLGAPSGRRRGDQLPRPARAAAGVRPGPAGLCRPGMRSDARSGRGARGSPTPSTRSARAIAFTPGEVARAVRGRAGAGPAGQAACRPAERPRRRGAGRTLRRALGRPSRVHQRARGGGHGRSRHGGRAAAGRVLPLARDPRPPIGAVPRARGADGGRDRRQSGHVAPALAAARPEHGLRPVRPHRARRRWPA